MRHQFIIVKWLNCLHISINDKNVQKVDLKGNIN